MNDVLIDIKNAVVEFDGERVLNGLNLQIHDKEFVTFLGPSGCGKTTTLRIIGGFIEPLEGDIFFDGKRINALPPYKRAVNTVFQRYALFPHLNVYENIAFGLRLKKLPDREIASRVGEMLEMVNLRGFEKRGVGQLSGGQQQRVAVARALATHPSLILADEPTGNLDSKSTRDIMELIHELHRQGNTIVLITHDDDIAQEAQRQVRIMDGKIVSDSRNRKEAAENETQTIH